MMFLRYIQSVTYLVLRAPFVRAALVASAVAFVLPAVLPLYTGGAQYQGGYWEQVVWPEAQKSQDSETVALVEAIVHTPQGASRYEAMANYWEHLANTGGMAYEQQLSLRASALLTSQIAATPEMEAYASSSQEPGSYFLAAQATDGLPYFVWYAPCVAICLGFAHALSRGRLLCQVPVGPRLEIAGVWLSGFAASMFALAVCTGPGVLIATVRNGWGSLEWPAVYIQGNEIVQSSVGNVLAGFIGLLIVSTGFMCLVSAVLTRYTRSVKTVGATIAIMLFVPLVLDSSAVSQSLDWLLPYLPMTYFSPSGAIGRVSYVMANVSPVGSLNVGGGCVACGLATFLIASVAFIAGSPSRSTGGFKRLPGCRDARGAGCLEIKRLVLGHAGPPVLASFSTSLLPGTSYGFVAPNGAGKTTLLRMLSGWAPKYCSGEICLEGTGISNGPAYRHRVFYCEADERSLYPWITARKHYELVCALWPHARSIEDAIDAFGINDFADKPVRTLSQGMQQLVALGCAWMSGATYLLLDEPTNALDPLNARRVTETLRKLLDQGACVVAASHIPETIEALCDEIIDWPPLRQGKKASEAG